MHNCIVCGAPLDKDTHLMMCANMPASAQDIPAADDLETERGVDLQLCQCSCCGLVQFDCEPVSYYRDVIRSGGYSTTMTQLRRNQYHHFIELCQLKGKRVIEIGCGQGEFLKVLSQFHVEAYGIEHKDELVQKAQSLGLNVWKEFAETEDTVLSGGPYDAFVSFNFLEHQPDPNGMLRCIYRNLSEDGCGLITVPSLDYILANNSFYELLRDHIANYSEETLRFLLNKNGFTVLESGLVNRDTITMIVKKRPHVNMRGLQESFHHMQEQMQEYISKRSTAGRRIAVWGASHQAFTALSTTGVGGEIQYVIDSAPFKQGRYTPASHIPIVPPDHFFSDPVDCVLIIAPGYTDEIAQIIRDQFGRKVEIAAIRTDCIEILSV